MQSFLSALVHIDPVALVKAGGYLGIALIIFAESGILLGVFLPGDSILFAAGLLAALNLLSVWPLILLVILAAILGDSVGYWIGAKAGDALFARPDSRFFKHAWLERTERFYERYGGRAVILARFVPVVRTVAPLLAGVGSMPYRRFLSYNVIGGTLWSAGMVLVGYLLGSTIPNSEQYLLPFSLVIIVLSFLPILVNLARNKKRTD